MNIIVCVKPVPDPEKYHLLKIDTKTKRLIREGIPTILNPCDRTAVEAALQLKETHGGKVVILSMAPLFSQDRIREALAMGADEAYIACDALFAGADTFSTSYTLMKAIEALGVRFDLILTGTESADGATANVPTQLAEWLSYPHATGVSDIEVRDGYATVRKKIEQGRIGYRIKLPVLLSVEKNAYRPRLISAMNVIGAGKKTIGILTAETLGVDECRVGLKGSPTRAGELIQLDLRRAGREISGEPEEIARRIVDIAKKSGVNC
ncbi:MAG: electron transfer flavoprotein subunit beta/FixA family protein [Clostridiales Family XIII bacterium]|jgi:electron transfer flavoprotein beta subunit|nr:electron transfer flavoprotein subunit beta/FixA family protein [Clostridiales Family XIII bacterium]